MIFLYFRRYDLCECITVEGRVAVSDFSTTSGGEPVVDISLYSDLDFVDG